MSGPVFHGGRLDEAVQKYGGAPDQWLDLSTGINPNAYPIGDVPEFAWQRLPDRNAELKLYDAARQYYQVPKDFGIIAANGTQVLIEMVPRVVDSQRIDILSPTYEEHAQAWKKNGRHVELIEAVESRSLISNALVIVNPNNPDGNVLTVPQLETLADDLALRHGYLILDEAFCDADPDLSFIPKMRSNVLIYRSFGKFFGLAGLRLGFLIANRDIVHQIENQFGPWNVSGPALAIGTKALADHSWIEQTRTELGRVSESQQLMLKNLGFEIAGTNALFTYTDHSHAEKIYKELLKQHILIRKFPGMPTKLRFGLCKDLTELKRLEAALSQAMAGL